MAAAKTRPTPVAGSGGNALLASLVGARSPFHTRQALWGYLFALPWIIGLVIFWLGPIFTSLYYSFTEFPLFTPPRWTGIANFERAFTTDPLFWSSLGRTFYFTVLYVPAAIIGSLLLALLLNQKLRGTNIFRTIFFIPHLVPAVALAVVWLYLMQPRLGPINEVLRAIGIAEPPLWLGSAATALQSVTLINIWAAVGGNNMLIFLAALQGVPQDFYEAAEIDGASPYQKFFGITLPLITPSVFFVLVLTIIAALKVFTTAMVATQGGPSYATWFYLIHIYTEAFLYLRMGYGSALAWVLALILIVFTFIQTAFSRKWVHYESN